MSIPDETIVAESEFIDDCRYTGGFHGTDEMSGLHLAINGFDPEHSRETFFAPPDDRWLATTHGKVNAVRTNQARYALLKASFPLKSKSQPVLGGPCLRFYGEEVKGISIIALAIFKADDDRLIATYDQAALERLRQD